METINGLMQIFLNYADDSKWVGVEDGTNRSVVLEPQDDYLERKILRPGEKYSHFFTPKKKKINHKIEWLHPRMGYVPCVSMHRGSVHSIR